MNNYFKTDQITITDFSDENIESLYENGYLFTRISRGVMNQTRSLRINLSLFEPSSENRRVLSHTEGLQLEKISLPIPESEYDWNIAKLAKDFYEKKFSEKIFSVNKTKELLTSESSNFNSLLKFEVKQETMGYVICVETVNIFHYAYPFYEFEKYQSNFGLGMMLNAILDAKSRDKGYFYLGSYTRESDKYKLQFKGLEWFDGTVWKTDVDELKKIALS